MDPVNWCGFGGAWQDLDGRETGAEVRVVGKIGFCVAGYCTPVIPYCLGVAVTINDQRTEERIPCGLVVVPI